MWWHLWPSRKRVDAESRRLLHTLPQREEVSRLLDRALARRFQEQFERIRKATRSLEAQTQQGSLDPKTAESARGELARQAALLFRNYKDQTLDHYQKGVEAFQAGEYESALRAFERALEACPLPAFRRALAQTLLAGGGDPQQAQELLETARQEYATTPEWRAHLETLWILAWLLEQQDHPLQARVVLTEALSLAQTRGDRAQIRWIRAYLRCLPHRCS